MVSNPPVRPALPNFIPTSTEPEQYRAELETYIQHLVQALEEAYRQIDTPGVVSASAFDLIDFPTDGSGLPVGAVFLENGFLRAVREGEIFVAPLSLTTELGTVIVSTP